MSGCACHLAHWLCWNPIRASRVRVLGRRRKLGFRRGQKFSLLVLRQRQARGKARRGRADGQAGQIQRAWIGRQFSGWAIVQYESKAAPAEIIEAYAKRCESLKAKVTGRPAPEQKDDTISVRLDCEFEGYLTAEFYAERKSTSAVSEVSLRVWGME